jgi:hypothetical protein
MLLIATYVLSAPVSLYGSSRVQISSQRSVTMAEFSLISSALLVNAGIKLRICYGRFLLHPLIHYSLPFRSFHVIRSGLLTVVLNMEICN